MGFKSVAQVAINCASVVLAVVVGFVLIPRAAQRLHPEKPSPAYAVGDRFEALRGVSAQDVRPTLVLVVSSDCEVCRRNGPFYARLSAARASMPSRVRLIGV